MPAPRTPATQPAVPHPGPGEAIPVDEAFGEPAAGGEAAESAPPPETVETKREAQEERTVGKA